MQIYDTDRARERILRRPLWDEIEISGDLANGIESVFGERIAPDEAVRRILHDVRERGDAALLDWAQRVDSVSIDWLVAPTEALTQAVDQIDPEIAEAMQLAAGRIEAFHRRQPSLSWVHNDRRGLWDNLSDRSNAWASMYPEARRRCPAHC